MDKFERGKRVDVGVYDDAWIRGDDGIKFNGTDYWNGKYPNVEFSTLCLMLQDPYGDFSEIKVLGNIIDNPELLQDEKINKERD